MIQFKIKLQTTRVSVNPLTITHIIDRRNEGTVIHFTNGSSVLVDESYDNVLSKISGTGL